jgi:autoinducer 2-degrading protein
MYVVVGLHQIKPERLAEYLENVQLHARNSAGEPGCLHYDVLQDKDDATLICLVEAFADEDAFLAHRAAEHYRWWMELSKDWRVVSPVDRHVMDYVTREGGET